MNRKFPDDKPDKALLVVEATDRTSSSDDSLFNLILPCPSWLVQKAFSKTLAKDYQDM